MDWISNEPESQSFTQAARWKRVIIDSPTQPLEVSPELVRSHVLRALHRDERGRR